MKWKNIIIVFLAISSVWSQEIVRHLAFIGIDEKSSPSLSKIFEKRLCTQLQSFPEISLTSNEKSEYYREFINFSRYPVGDKERIIRLERTVNDSLFLLWGGDITTTLYPLRKRIFGSVIVGKCSVHLTLFNLSSKKYLYNGTISSEVAHPGSPVFFASPSKSIHISSSERASINDSLIDKVVSNSAVLISSLIRNDTSSTYPKQQPEIAAEHAPPSISDVFSLPSVEPPKITDQDESDSANNKAPRPQALPRTTLDKNSSVIKTK